MFCWAICWIQTKPSCPCHYLALYVSYQKSYQPSLPLTPITHSLSSYYVSVGVPIGMLPMLLSMGAMVSLLEPC